MLFVRVVPTWIPQEADHAGVVAFMTNRFAFPNQKGGWQDLQRV
jgi:hypothetical protein